LLFKNLALLMVLLLFIINYKLLFTYNKILFIIFVPFMFYVICSVQ